MPRTMTKPRVVHFDLGSTNPQRAADFYSRVFGWEFQKWEGSEDYWMIKSGEMDEPGIDGGLSQMEPGCTMVTIGVENLDAYQAKVLEAGGKLLMEKMPITGVGWFSQFEDTEGNKVGLIQMDENAG